MTAVRQAAAMTAVPRAAAMTAVPRAAVKPLKQKRHPTLRPLS